MDGRHGMVDGCTVCSAAWSRMDQVRIENQHEESNDARDDAMLSLAKISLRYMRRGVLCSREGVNQVRMQAKEKFVRSSPSPQIHRWYISVDKVIMIVISHKIRSEPADPAIIRARVL